MVAPEPHSYHWIHHSSTGAYNVYWWDGDKKKNFLKASCPMLEAAQAALRLLEI